MHDLLQRAAAQVDLVEHQRQRILDGRQSGRRLRIRLLLFLERVRRVIGRHNLNSPIAETLP